MISNLVLNAAVSFDLGLGFDFGNIRIEATWDRITSGGAEFGDNDLDKDKPLMATRRLSTTTSKIPLS